MRDMEQQRIIIHLDMDCFFAQIEERENPRFRGEPVVVGADPKNGKGRGVVSTANYEARKFGIHSALPISKAYQLCPSAVFLPPNFELYQKVSNHIMEIIHGFSPLMEQVSLDEAYIDVSFVKSYEKAYQLAEKMRRKILEQEKLTCSCGVGPNKMIAKITCEAAKPNGIKMVKAQDAEAFVEPLDVEKMPGIGKKTAEVLQASHIRLVSDLKRLSGHDLEDLFGVRGKAMYGHVRGVDENPVTTEREIKSAGKETTFEKDTRDPELLIQTLEQLILQVVGEIKEQKLMFKGIAVVCRFTGFETHTKSKTVKPPSANPSLFHKIATNLFLQFIVENKKPVRLIGIRALVA